MFGFFEAIYAFLTRQLGARGDSASQTGSLHAKVSSLFTSITSSRNYLFDNLQKPLGVVDVGTYTGPNEWSTAYLTDGKGRLHSINLTRTGGGGEGWARLIVDGHSLGTTYKRNTTNSSSEESHVYIGVNFNESLEIQVQNSESNQQYGVFCRWVVEKE